MMIERAANHIRACLNQPGVKIDQIARKAGLSWETVKKASEPGSDPKLSTLAALESAIAEDRKKRRRPPHEARA
ncbi:hypothetical protein Sp245p_03425 [Azospirillum baldaniorum]|uniref:hypothetical protein n=1 Tax=Azospirillum baldaniorum TaxID=1064539 RepID=UPI000D6029BA|nr:hypothetical protein [Azospirillum baldaniorum]AWJ88905.1 hypothetical protein Sp245p_03425 [Azospirillum baldaniorum]TWA73386.1 hypothetical protein FBZ85_11678 [Azospirillum brasilense]